MQTAYPLCSVVVAHSPAKPRASSQQILHDEDGFAHKAAISIDTAWIANDA
jgi:hypothetical protein